MYVPFSKLPDHARVWIYQSNKFIEPAQRLILERELLAFTSTWAAHGKSLEASFSILEDHFVVLAVDENQNGASGCSIDLSTHTIKHLEELTGIDFFDRGLIPFEINGQVTQIRIQELKEKFNSGELSEDSVTFNILADTIDSLRHMWRIPASKSWIKRYIGPKTFDSITG
ncbi:MAG TPA: hypothetical protein VFW11_17955 [Cyclobacteriaceae bacterium]|nr:hypothetical protein [Cyclobacteriaceae bacterium]